MSEETYNQLCRDVEDIKEELRTERKDRKSDMKKLFILLKGAEGSDTPEGLVYSVNENTKFREKSMKVFWILFTANAGLVGYLLYQLFEVVR